MFLGVLMARMGLPHFGQLTFDVLKLILSFRLIVPTTEGLGLGSGFQDVTFGLNH